MSLKRRIQNLKRKNINNDEALSRIIYIYRDKFNLSHQEILDEPIPTFFSNLYWLKKEQKDKKKTMRGKKYG